MPYWPKLDFEVPAVVRRAAVQANAVGRRVIQSRTANRAVSQAGAVLGDTANMVSRLMEGNVNMPPEPPLVVGKTWAERHMELQMERLKEINPAVEYVPVVSKALVGLKDMEEWQDMEGMEDIDLGSGSELDWVEDPEDENSDRGEDLLVDVKADEDMWLWVEDTPQYSEWEPTTLTGVPDRPVKEREEEGSRAEVDERRGPPAASLEGTGAEPGPSGSAPKQNKCLEPYRYYTY